MSNSRMLLVLSVGLAVAALVRAGTNVTTVASADGCQAAAAAHQAHPRECCRSFPDFHQVTIECLARPPADDRSPCLAQCVLQSYGVRPEALSTPISMSSIITTGPKLAAHFDQCKVHLFDFLMGSTLDGDFRRVVCDDRLNRFLQCLVESWFTDCIGFDESNGNCTALRDRMQTSSCPIASFFAVPKIA